MNTTENYSPGLEGVIAGETAISTLTTGLLYRGYDIQDLTAHASFEETAYLVFYGELPSAEQLANFSQRLTGNMHIPSEVVTILQSLPATANAMDVMRTGASLIAHWDTETEDNTPNATAHKAERILAKMPVIMATRQRWLQGQQPIAADSSLGFAANVLFMLRGSHPSQRHIEAMNASLILYAEHEFNASTFAARCICSTQSDLHSAIVGAIGTLKGALHGGANERALEVLLSVGGVDKAESWIHNALTRKERIMGFGHRVYKTVDPRASYLKALCTELAKEAHLEELEATANIIERVVGEQKKLPANVDWPCARLYYYLGIPSHLFTPLFVVARVVGWSAHVREQLANNRLMRPSAIYTGLEHRSWLPINQR
jgi:2-methylcitrate synthase/citrate synthase II